MSELGDMLYGGAGSSPPYSAPDTSAISSAILGQESGNNPDAPTSVNGAVGRAQITPSTFAQYALPGERIDNDADNLAVHKRIVDDLNQKANGDPARVAVGYFSGPGNIAPPDSPTPWKKDHQDGNGKSVSSYVSDVMGRIGNSIVPGAQASEVPAHDLGDTLYGNIQRAPNTQSSSGDLGSLLYGSPEKQPSVGEDLEKSLGTGAIKGGTNLAASLLANTNPVTGAAFDATMAAKYGLPAVAKGANYLASDLAAPIRKLMGKPAITPEQEKQIEEETTGGPEKLAAMIPSPADAAGWIAKQTGHPLYEAQYGPGKVAEGTLEYPALAGKNALQAVLPAFGVTAAPEAVKSLGGGEQAQYWAGLAGAGAGLKAPEMAKSAAETAGNIKAGAFGGTSAEKLAKNVEDLKSNAAPYYAATANNGAVFDPATTDTAVSNIKSEAKNANNGSDYERFPTLYPETNKFLDTISTDAANRPWTVADYDAYGRLINQHLKDARSPEDIRALMASKSALRDELSSKTGNDMVGRPDAIADLQQAQKLSLQSFAYEKLTDIANRAGSDPKKIQQEMADLAADNKSMAQFTPAQQQMIRDASKASFPAKTLNLFGKLGVDVANWKKNLGAATEVVAGAMHPVIASAIAPATLAKYGTRFNARGKLENIMKNVAEPLPPPQYGTRNATAAQPLAQLPPPNINVPPGGFAQPAAQPPLPQTGPVAAAQQRQLAPPKEMSFEDMVKAGRILPNQPRPDFASTPEGRAAGSNGPQVGPYQFGQQEGMPFQTGELNDVRARSGQYQNMPIGSERGQSTFINAVNNPGVENTTVSRSMSQPTAPLDAAYADTKSQLEDALAGEKLYLQQEHANAGQSKGSTRKSVQRSRTKNNAGKNVQGNE